MNIYRWNSGTIFLGGGLSVEVEAASPEEARQKVEAALKSFRVCVSESQTTAGGVRFAYAFENHEQVLDPSMTEELVLRAGDKVRLLRDSMAADEHDAERVIPAGTIGVVTLVERLPPPQGLTAHVAFHDGVTLVLDESDRSDWEVTS